MFIGRQISYKVQL